MTADSISEAHHKPEEVLEVQQFVSSWRRQLAADLVLSNHFTETVAKIQIGGESKINPNVRPQDWSS